MSVLVSAKQATFALLERLQDDVSFDDLETIGSFYVGRKVPEIDHDLVRELIVERYRIVYRLTQEYAEIVVVLDGRQDLIKKFRERR